MLQEFIEKSLTTSTMFITVLVFYFTMAILMFIRQIVWEKTSKKIKCKVLCTKVYKEFETGIKSYLNTTTKYPLTISKVLDTDNKERYVLTNAVQRKICFKNDQVELYQDKTGATLIYREIPRIAKMSIPINLLGYYIVFAIAYSLTYFVADKVNPYYINYACLGVTVLSIVAVCKLFIEDFLLFHIKTKYKFEKIKDKNKQEETTNGKR